MIWGPHHVHTKDSQVQSFCNSLWSKTEDRSEEAAEEEDTSQRQGYRDPGGAGMTAAKDRYGELLRRSQKGQQVTRPAELPPQVQWRRWSK